MGRLSRPCAARFTSSCNSPQLLTHPRLRAFSFAASQASARNSLKVIAASESPAYSSNASHGASCFRYCPEARPAHGDKNVETLDFYPQIRVDHLATWHADRLAMNSSSRPYEFKRYKGLGRVMPNRVVAGELQEIARQTRRGLFDRRWRQRLLNNGLLMVKTAS